MVPELLAIAASANDGLRILSPAELQETSAALCMAIAAEDLAGRPVYVVLVSQAGPEWRQAVCHGWTWPGAWRVYREAIGKTWQGAGPCIVVNDVAIAELDRRPADMLASAVYAVALHELAHVVAEEWAADRSGSVDTPSAAADERFVSLVGGLLADGARHSSADARRRELRHHDAPRFVRTALHLLARARRLGVDLPATLLSCGRHDLSYQGYETLLADAREPELMLGKALAGLPSVPLPAGYAELWQRDQEYFDRHLGDLHDVRGKDCGTA